MEPSQPILDFKYIDLLNYCVTLNAAEQTDYEMKANLKARGIDDRLIDKVISESRELYEEAVNKKANRNIIIGSVLLVIGLLITLGTYSSGGGRYVITYGAILGGIAQIIGGIVQKNKI
jgi:hypothetical protein